MAGTPNARAKIAACEFCDPWIEITPLSISLGHSANIDAVISVATKINGLSGNCRACFVGFNIYPKMRFDRSIISTARSCM